MKRTEVFKTMTVKKQMSSFYRDGILLILCIIAMILGYFFQKEIGLGLFITTSVLSSDINSNRNFTSYKRIVYL